MTSNYATTIAYARVSGARSAEQARARRAPKFASGGRAGASSAEFDPPKAAAAADDWMTPELPSGRGKPAASFDPDAYLATDPKKSKALPDASSLNDWGAPPDSPSLLSRIATPITDIPREAYRSTADALSDTAENLNPFSEKRREAARRGDVLEQYKMTGKGLLSAIGVPFAPIQGAARSLLGHPLSAVMPTATPEEQARMRKAGVPDSMIPRQTREENYEQAKEGVDLAMSALAPRGVRTTGPAAVRPSAPPATVGDFNTPLSVGEATGNLSNIRDEHLARRGGLGDRAAAAAERFDESRNAGLATARADIAREMDPHGGIVARDPQEAAGLVSEAIQREAANQRAGYKALYDEFTSAPGQFEKGTFQAVRPSIVRRLGESESPVILDEASRVVTPNAHRALDFLESYFQEPGAPIGARSMDRVGKALVSIYQDAKAVPSDRRATGRVLDAFGKHIDDALDAGLFSGSPETIQTWKDARAAFAKYKQNFGPRGPGDDVGRVMEKIIGRYDGQAATPTEVANYLYGATNTGAKGLSVRLADRVRDTLGAASPEWAGVKQGLWSKLTETPQGKSDWGPQKVSENIYEFLNGSGQPLARKMYGPAERDLMDRYAAVLKRMVPPPGTVNYSNSAPIMQRLAAPAARAAATAMGMALHGPLGAMVGWALSSGAKSGQAILNARRIAKSLPDVEASLAKWQHAQQRLAERNSPPTQRAAQVASTNLARSLQSIGIDPVRVIADWQNLTSGNADEKQQPPRRRNE